MRLLTIGAGERGAKISEMFVKRGAKINKIPLFKCYAISDNTDLISKLNIDDERKFFILKNDENVDVKGFLNSVFSKYEFIEGSLLITSLIDDYGFIATYNLGLELRDLIEDPIIGLAIIPELDRASIEEIRRRIKKLKEAVDILILFEDKPNMEELLLNSLNTLSLVGEVDMKKRLAGEVVIDTSDVFNTLIKDGFSVIGYSTRRLQLNWYKKVILSGKSEIKGLRTKRMIEMFQEAMKNLSIQGDIEEAKTALIVFSGNPNEITMEGLFSCITMLEKMNPEILVRYGDCPIARSMNLSVVLLFSGIRRFKF
ncbi:MAG: cell division protein [Archaeoglobaceae archaeon]|nr:cell division protein [Archaeoglobaceae archaeon]HDN82729.1 cell division protein [Candidatus Altiarchaeales archaeon]